MGLTAMNMESNGDDGGLARFREVVVLTAMWGFAACAMAQAASAPAQVAPVDVELPAVLSRWKSPGDELMPVITVNELGICMGRGIELKRRVQVLTQQRDVLGQQQGPLEHAADEIRLRSPGISEEQARLKDVDASLSASAHDLAERSALIQRRKAGPPHTQKDVDEINALVARYNADGKAFNQRRASALSNEEVLKARIEAYNARVVEFNNRVAEFAEKAKAFDASWTSLRGDSDAYHSDCNSAHRIEK